MKYMIASDIHGSAWYCRKMMEALEKEMLRPWKQRKAKERDLKDIPETEKQTTKEFLTAAVETEEQLAVECGYWNNFRYNPAAKAEGKDAFTLDSKAPTGEYQEFLNGEVRYNSLMRSNPEKAKKLFAKNEAEAKARYEYLNKLTTLYGADKTEE